MDSIEILFKEYDTLREEVVARTNNSYQVVGFAATFGVALVAWIATHPSANSIFFWIVGAITTFFVIVLFMVIRNDLTLLCSRLQELEAEINQLAGAHLLQWETQWGPQALGMGPFRRRRK